MGERGGDRGCRQLERTSRAHWRCVAVRRRARAANQRPVDRIADAESARHPHRVERGWHAHDRIHLRRLDLEFGVARGPGGPLRRPGAGAEHGRLTGVVELGACQPELRRHGAARWRWPVLLLRTLTAGAILDDRSGTAELSRFMKLGMERMIPNAMNILLVIGLATIALAISPTSSPAQDSKSKAPPLRNAHSTLRRRERAARRAGARASGSAATRGGTPAHGDSRERRGRTGSGARAARPS